VTETTDAAADATRAGADTGADLASVDADQLAALAAGATDEQLAEGMSDPAARRSILDEIFRRMAEHLDADKAKGTDAVLLWRITDRPGGGEDSYQVTLKDGQVRVSQEPAADPRVTFIVGPAAFLRLVSGAQSGPVLFMAGKLKIEGDLMFASQVATMFKIPQATS
jgi:alkyl sulfatase BDS1-like metallo-beta-lactamase superfamily hydrolase